MKATQEQVNRKKRLKMGHFPMLAFELFKLMLMFNFYVHSIVT